MSCVQTYDSIYNHVSFSHGSLHNYSSGGIWMFDIVEKRGHYIKGYEHWKFEHWTKYDFVILIIQYKCVVYMLVIALDKWNSDYFKYNFTIQYTNYNKIICTMSSLGVKIWKSVTNVSSSAVTHNFSFGKSICIIQLAT